MNPGKEHLQPTGIIDSDHESVRAFAQEHADGSRDPVERAVGLYYGVRDGIRYNPYTVELTVKGLRASTTLEMGEAWCVAKAVLLTACCRAMGIPARIGFADVRNHLSTERMRQAMKTDVFHWHGYSIIHLEGKWVKATPAFNVELCEKFRLKTLEFDGKKDSLYHPFDLQGNQHMEYVRFRGEFDDVPIKEMQVSFMKRYSMVAGEIRRADFDEDCSRENEKK